MDSYQTSSFARIRTWLFAASCSILTLLLPLSLFLLVSPVVANPGVPTSEGLSPDRYASTAIAGVSAATPMVATDKADYGPGETASITGSGFAPNETVLLRVIHTTPVAAPGAGHAPWEVAADAFGNFTSQWFVDPDDSLGASFLLTTYGTTSGLQTTTTFTDASAPLSITLTSQETFWLDANKCNAEGPRGAWLSFVITNTSATTTLTNVTVDFAGFTGLNASYFKAPTDLTRTFLSLAPGAAQPAFFYVDYAEVCKHPKGGGSPYTGYTANYTIAANAAGYSPAFVRNGTVLTGDLLSANAAGISQTSVLGLGTYLGQVQTQTVTYAFGNNSDLFFQPAGDANFPDRCIRFIGSEVTATSGGVTGILGQKNRLAFPTASVPGGGGTITILYTWEINCLSTSVTAHPWAGAKSGNQYKYKGFAASSMVSASLPTLTVDKSASPVSQASNGPITWTVVFTNSAPVTIYLDSISDTIPGCMALTNATASGSQVTAPPSGNSFSVPPDGASGPVTWVGNNLGYPVAANSTLTLKYTTNTSCADGVYTNAAMGETGTETVGPATASVNIGLEAALGLTKTVSPSSFSSAGQSLTYTYVIRNTGTTTPVPGPFTVTDTMPLTVLGVSYAAGTPFPCGAGPLAPGATTSCTATYTTTTADVTAGTVSNSATASGSGLTSGPAYEMANFSGPGLTLTKTPTLPTFQGSGSVITYTYIIKNTGAAVLSGPFSVTDDHLGTFTCGTGPLAEGATTNCTRTYTVTSGDATAGFVTNTATVSGNGITSSPAQATVTQAQVPGVAVAKSASPTIYNAAGAAITYTYTVTNTGNTSLTSVTISDNHLGSPLGTAFACGSGTLAAGASRTCTATYTTTAADVTAGSVTNSATASAVSGSGGNQVTVRSDPASATISMAAPALTMAKSVTETSYATVGTVLHYSYLVKNTGNVAFTSPITISDNKINGGTSFTCGPGNLAVGATITCSATYTVTQSDLNAGSVTNSAAASGSYGGSSVVSPTDSRTVPAIQSPALALAKAVNPATYTTLGQVVTYTYTITNTGNVTLIGPFTVTDDRQGAFTCGSGPVVPTEATSCTSTHTINTWGDISAGFLTNSATVSGNGVTSSTATATTTFAPTVLTGIITDAITHLPISGATVVVTDSAGYSCTLTTGADGRYTLTYSESTPFAAGPATVSVGATGYITATATPTVVAGTTVTQNLALSYVSLSGIVTDLGAGVPIVGATVTLYDGTHTCTTTTGDGGAYHFVAPTCPYVIGGITPTVTASQTKYENASAAPTILSSGPTTQDLALGTVDMVIYKTDHKSTASPGESLTYTLTVVNNGSITANAVTLVDTLPTYLTYVSATGTGWTCTPDGTNKIITCDMDSPGILASKATTTITLVADVAASLPDGETSISNYARVSTTSPEADTTNNEVSDVDTVTTHPDLTIAKTFTSTPPAGSGSTVSYRLSGGNIGYATATSVTIVDTLDSMTTYQTGTAYLTINSGTSQAITPFPTSPLTFSLPNLAPGDTYILIYELLVGSLGADPPPLHNTAVISEHETDLNPATNTAGVYVPTKAGQADVYLVKSAAGDPDPAAPVVPGGKIMYTLSYGNSGPADAANVTITDAVPANTTFFSATGGGTLNGGTGTVTWDLGPLSNGATGSVTLTVEVDTPLPAGATAIANTATISTTTTESTTANNTSGTTTPVTAQPDLKIITKTDGTTQVLAGDTVTYTITYENVGNIGATDVTIVDTLLNGVAYVSSSPTGTPGPGTVTWNIGTLEVDDPHSITLTVEVDSNALPSSVAADRVTITGSEVEPTPEDNTATDSDLVIAPYIVLEKSVSIPTGNHGGVVYTGQELTYAINWHNTGAAAAEDLVITDTLPAGTILVPGSITEFGTCNADPCIAGSTITWNLGSKAANAAGTVGFRVTVNVEATSASQTTPTLSTETGSDNVTVTSSTSLLSLPYCDIHITGTVAVTQNITAVTGTGTAFTAELAAGNWISIKGVPYKIASVTDDTHLILTADYAGTTDSGITALNATCLVFRDNYQGVNGTPPLGYNDNPRMTVFDDSDWLQPLASSEAEYDYWTDPANLSAEWVAPNTDGHLQGVFTFFRQAFCLPLNATGLSAKVDLAGDDAADIYLNGVHLGQEYGAGAADAFDGNSSIQSGINMLAVQLLTNRHGGHAAFGGQDHIGLLFNLGAAYKGLRPFASAPSTVKAGQAVIFTVDDLALGGRQPYKYKINYGDGDSEYQAVNTFEHSFDTPGVYTVAVTARAGYGCTGTDTLTVTVLPDSSTLLANPATVAYQDANAHGFSGTSGSGLDLHQAADLAITKTDEVGAVDAGRTTTYTIVVGNNGPATADGAIFTDPAAEGLTMTNVTCGSPTGGAACPAVGDTTVSSMQGAGIVIPTLPNGGRVTFTVNATVTATSGSVRNMATVTAPVGVTDLIPDNNSAGDTDTVAPLADLAITKAASPNPVLAGTLLTYTLAVSNAGPSVATSPTVTDTLPSGMTFVSATGTDWTCIYTESSRVVSCERATLAENSTRYLTLVVSTDTTAGGPITNTASVSSVTTDPNLLNNTFSESSTINPARADLSITKASSPNPALPGQNLTYMVAVHNKGPGDAMGATIADTFPAGVVGVTWTCGATSGSSCTASGTGGINDTINLKSGGTATYTAIGILDPSAVGVVSNTATVSPGSGTIDDNTTNNTTTNTNTPTATVLTGRVTVNGTPVDGVTVTVVDSAGHSYNTTTAGGGYYSFTGSAGSPLAVGTATVTASDGTHVPATATPTLVAGTNTQDLAIALTTEVRGVVFVDPARSGILYPNSLGLAGVTVNLLDESGTLVVATTTTAADGSYSFAGPAVAKYRVQVVDPTGYSGTTTNPVPIDVVSGTASIANFGEQPPVTFMLISRFRAAVQGGQVIVQWHTAAEVGTVGFYLERLDDASGEYLRLNDHLLPGLLTAPQGGVYRYVDWSATPGETYRYRLVEVVAKGQENIYGPFTVSATSGAPELATPGLSKQAGADLENETLVSGYSRKPYGMSAARNARLEAMKAERAAFGQSGLQAQAQSAEGQDTKSGGGLLGAAAAASGKARITVRENGLYYLNAATIASALRMSSASVMRNLKGKKFTLKNRNDVVAYTVASGNAGMYFYAQGIDSIYTRDNVYWLERGTGTSIGVINGTGPQAAPGNTFRETRHLEQEKAVLTGSFTDPAADYWVWDYVIAGNSTYRTKAFILNLPGVAGTGQGTLKVQFVGATTTQHHATVALNGQNIGESSWFGAAANSLEVSFDASLLLDGNNTVQVGALLDSGVSYGVFYVDSFDVTYERNYQAVNGQLVARGDTNAVVSVDGFSEAGISVYDLTDPRKPLQITALTVDQPAVGRYRASFVPATPTTPYLVLTGGAVKQPVSVTAGQVSTLKKTSNKADYLIIAPSLLKTAAQELADYRKKLRLKVKVVDYQDVVDEFNYGIASPEAIKTFLSYAYKSWQKPAPRYVVLVGEGSYDYRNILSNGDNLMPPLMAATPDGLFPSDNPFVDLENDDGVPEMAIGRLPVLTSVELKAMIGKIKTYEGSSGGDWKKRVLMVADNPDAGGSFQAVSDELFNTLPDDYKNEQNKIYVSASDGGSAARSKLLTAFRAGALLVNYIGHAGTDRLAAEGIMKTADVVTLNNAEGLPVLATMACSVGNFGIPNFDSLSEALVLRQGGGIIAGWVPTGLSFNALATLLDEGLFQALISDGTRVLGDAIIAAKTHYGSQGQLRFMLDIYNVLGDPALRMK